MMMNVEKKILGSAALALTLTLTACGGSAPRPRPEYDKEFALVMIRRLQDESPETRFGAAHALGELKVSVAQVAIPALRCAMQDKHPRVRKEAARALKKIDATCGEIGFELHPSGNTP
jgi:HEAT repeat protein